MRDALYLAYKEVRSRLAVLAFSAALCGLIGYVLGQHFHYIVSSGEQAQTAFFSLVYPMDFLLIAILPTFGMLAFSKDYWSWSTITEEPFLKRLRFYRMWAIPLRVIVWSRIWHVLLCLGAAMTAFAIVFIWSSWPAMSATASFAGYCAFLVALTSYAAASGALNPYVEFGMNGKAVFISSFILALSGFALACLFRFWLGEPLFLAVYRLAESHPLRTIAVSILCGALGVMLIQRALLRRLRRKDLP